MNPTPTGRLTPTPDGHDLILTRTFRAPIDDVWASVTEPGRTARWFGPWEGDAAVGRTIRVRPAFEENAPWSDARIEACEPPHRLALSLLDGAGDWHIELRLSVLSALGGATELRLIHHLTDPKGVGEVGPGWEYYLDMLRASRGEAGEPRFEDYYPAQRDYFAALAAEGSAR
ncbi:SRPBCC family protein [Streptomyces clavuligerus]|uniref:Activator of Hsp90 ATPase 1 family protein n=1 Tax=Streptomyces clavuligerus TaxID=1901 RepID=B5GMA2_STRCL|nr:SRPBCC family protein [Streptomyces clavuligerus]ANW22330.1 ATPase [Streptomyces clavuligerus]AXU17229.1 ATPase [Streptomyces clavuligerus]EDY47448.1 conserved hypothetical protein [Streptomyces clavuligerus]EFG04411.1 Activator of Hsp90 ATPase 1 family protein [Streptomyces clavuligerus]MBY6307126.1 SRPBCC family protein [Streptomyces clavuligerus]